MKEKEFGELKYPKRGFKEKNEATTYRIYKNKKDFILVEANTALEAIRKSEITTPFKVVKYSKLNETAIPTSVLDELQDIDEDSSSASSIPNNIVDVSPMIDTSIIDKQDIAEVNQDIPDENDNKNIEES